MSKPWSQLPRSYTPVESSTSIPDTWQKISGDHHRQRSRLIWSYSKLSNIIFINDKGETMRHDKGSEMYRHVLYNFYHFWVVQYRKFTDSKAVTSPVEISTIWKQRKVGQFLELSSGAEVGTIFFCFSWQWQRFAPKFKYGLLYKPSWSPYENRCYKGNRR